MDHRRSSFLIGSRTRTNVLKGKYVRKQDDGADNFADYWTDSGGEDTSATDSDNYSDLSKTQKESHVSDIRLKSLNQNVRTISSSSSLHSETKGKDKQGHGKILRSLKPVKNKISGYDKNIHSSPTKKQKVSSKLQQVKYQNSTISLNNVFNPCDQSPVRNECNLTSIISQHSVSDSEGAKEQTEITATSALLRIKNKVESSQISSSTFLTSNNNKKENIELNTSHHSAKSLKDSVRKKASPLLPKSKGKQKKIVSPKKSLVSRNLNETISLPPASDCNGISTSSLSPISKQSKERRKTFVINENVSQASLHASDIHVLSSVKVISADANLTNATGSESLANKTSHERNSHIEHKEASSIFKSGSRNHTVMKLRSSSQNKTFAKYDEYDAKIMEMVHDNESSLKVLAKERSSTFSSPKPIEENEADSNNSESDGEYEEINVVSQKKTDGNVKNQNSEGVSNNEILSRSQQKNSVSRDRINAKLIQNRLVSSEENFELADISHTSLHNHKSQTENTLLSKSAKNLAHLSQASGRNVGVSCCALAESALDSSELEDEIPEDLDSKKRKHVSKIHKSALDTSESENEIPKNLVSKKRKHLRKIHKSALDTSESENEIPKNLVSKKRKHLRKIHKSDLDSSESENEIPEDLASKKRKHVIKIHKNLKVSKTISRDNVTDIPSEGNEMSQNFGNEERKNVNKTHKKVKASETFSAKNTESVTDIPANENEISRNLNNKKEIFVNKIPKISKVIKSSLSDNVKSATDIPANEIFQNFDNEREKHANNTHENLVAFSTESTENVADVPAKERETMQNLHIRRKKPVSKIYEDLKTSRTLSKNSKNIDPVINNGGTPNFHSKKKKNKNKSKKKQNDSETFIRDNQNTDDFLEAETGTTIHKKRKKHATESHQNLSHKENNDQPVSSHKKKKGNEIHSTDENAPLRRSVRQKFPPLASWRNERLLYQIQNGVTTVIGIDKGTKEDDKVLKALQRRLNTDRTKKEKRVVKKFTVENIVRNKKVHISLVKHFDSVPWEEEYQDKKCPYRIKRVFENETYASGFIQIEVNEEKPMQYMPNEDICLTVIRGKIEVTINKNADLLEERGMFIVPKCVPYCLKNVGSIKAVLSFFVGRFYYLEKHS